MLGRSRLRWGKELSGWIAEELGGQQEAEVEIMRIVQGRRAAGLARSLHLETTAYGGVENEAIVPAQSVTNGLWNPDRRIPIEFRYAGFVNAVTRCSLNAKCGAHGSDGEWWESRIVREDDASSLRG